MSAADGKGGKGSKAADSGDAGDAGFLSRWSRRKVQARAGVAETALPAPAAEGASPTVARPTGPAGLRSPTAGLAASPGAGAAPAAQATTASGSEPAASTQAAPPPPAPTLQDVQALGRQSDYSRFVAPDVDPTVKNAALKKLFTDPHFNVMDGLDVYIDDYGKPDPLPHSMLREMVQSRSLGLFDDDAATAGDAAATQAPATGGPPASADPAEAAVTSPPSSASPASSASTPSSAEPSAIEEAAGPRPQSPPTTPTPDHEAPAHEDPDLRLQRDPAAGRTGPGPGAVADPGRQP